MFAWHIQDLSKVLFDESAYTDLLRGLIDRDVFIYIVQVLLRVSKNEPDHYHLRRVGDHERDSNLILFNDWQELYNVYNGLLILLST